MTIIAVTNCSTGIAHTYMSAGGIEKACKKAGYACKVETQGSIGIEDKLSANEIAKADLVIFSADLPILERERFNGKLIYECGTNDFIKDRNKALQAAVNFYNNHQ